MNKRKKSIYESLLKISTFLFIGLIIISSYNIIKWFKDSNHTQEIIKEISDKVIINEDVTEEKEKYQVDFES